jgi:hypothetical protein
MKLHGNAALTLKKRQLLVSRVIEDASLDPFAASRFSSPRSAINSLDASAAGRLMRDALDGEPSTVSLHTYEVNDPEDPDAVLAIEVSGPPTLTTGYSIRPRT